ncbi:MAG: FkbM family methyltransferase [Selenomonadaceae bacterium]|nr:FkbM family methyltransferase [Selenomonadaceae bacterium]
MKNFVKLIRRIHEERYMKVLARLVKNKISVAFLSTMKISDAISTVKEFREQGLNITLLITTDTPVAENDFEIVALDDAAKIYPQPEYILTNDIKQIDARIALKNFPASKVLSLNRGNTERAYENFMTHLDELREVYESLIDEESKKTFCGYWLGNISNQIGEFVHSNSAHYLINGFIPERGAIVIDAGVFDGGTSVVFAQMGYKVYGFEIDRITYEYARKLAEENNFVLEHLGLGSYKHEMRCTPSGRGDNHLTDDGTETVRVTTIDAYVREKNLPRVDFIKTDIEGAELDLLRGAVTTIARFKPILALSAYHKWDDFWTLMNFVKSIRPDYEFALRHSYDTFDDAPSAYSEEIFRTLKTFDLEPDLRGYGECVLFAR